MGTRALPSTRFDPLLCQQLGCSAESADVRRVSPETMRRGWSVLNGVWHRKRQRKTKGGGKNGHPAGSFSQELGVFHVGEKRSLAEIFVVDYGWASTPIELSLRYIRYNSSFQTKEELSLGFPLSFHSSFRGSKINFSRGILIRFSPFVAARLIGPRWHNGSHCRPLLPSKWPVRIYAAFSSYSAGLSAYVDLRFEDGRAVERNRSRVLLGSKQLSRTNSSHRLL